MVVLVGRPCRGRGLLLVALVIVALSVRVLALVVRVRRVLGLARAGGRRGGCLHGRGRVLRCQPRCGGGCVGAAEDERRRRGNERDGALGGELHARTTTCSNEALQTVGARSPN